MDFEEESNEQQNSAEEMLLLMRQQRYGRTDISLMDILHNNTQTISTNLNQYKERIINNDQQQYEDNDDIDDLDEDGDVLMAEANTYQQWRIIEEKYWDKYIDICKDGFKSESYDKQNSVEKAILFSAIQHLGRVARHKVFNAMKPGKARIRKDIFIGAMEPRLFDYFMKEAGGERSFRRYTKTQEDGSKLLQGCVVYSFEGEKYPYFGISDNWRIKYHYEVEDDVQLIVRKRVSTMTSCKVKCNVVSWEVRMDLTWKREVMDVINYDQENEQYGEPELCD
ncbi:predicted protein [Naegleria gruberi]|nr:uncharacterized protein NAEGRDRAFT_68915 [Naegleria gruberi]EFC43139.1 predicted protein [Naegleria gruberi]|eukprot:XP_002675883.1 predicted protein [Naegleria gruberi strain NEG-M]